jgi:hypothetical protein
MMEVMFTKNAWAQAASPKRYVVLFAGQSLGRDNSGKLTDIVPDGSGTNFTLRACMAPLADLKDHLIVVSQLRIPIGGPGGRASGFHKSSIGPLLTGGENPSTSPGGFTAATSDQVVAADAAFKGTKFPFLNYKVQAAPYRDGGATGAISYAGAGKRLDPTVSPKTAFNTLFGSFTPPPAGMTMPSTMTPPTTMVDPIADRVRRSNASVLDLVRSRADALQKRLGKEDQNRLARHFDEIRALELRLKSIPEPVVTTGAGSGGSGAPTGSGTGCQSPGAPPADADQAASTVAFGDGDIGYANEKLRAEVLTGLLVKAFACDLTRVATLQLTHMQCFMNSNFVTGVNVDVHELAHLAGVPGGAEGGQALFMKVWAWNFGVLAGLAKGLLDEIGPDGRPLLDNTVLVMTNEGGLGPAEGKNPGAHSTENMMVVTVGGRNLGLKTGRHIVANNDHPAKVLSGAMHAVGVPKDLGQITGRLEAMFTG